VLRTARRESGGAACNGPGRAITAPPTFLQPSDLVSTEWPLIHYGNPDKENRKVLASQIQAQSRIQIPASVAAIMASAGLDPIYGKIGVPDLDRKLHAAGVPIGKRLELKLFLNRAGLLVD
jgi:hypothetical protein